MPPQPVILESQNATSAADGATIERRIRISQPGEGRRRCKGSRAWDPRKDFSQPTQPPITPSTSNAISPQQERTEPSGPQPCRRGAKSSPPHDSAVKPDEPASNFQQRDNAILAYNKNAVRDQQAGYLQTRNGSYPYRRGCIRPRVRTR